MKIYLSPLNYLENDKPIGHNFTISDKKVDVKTFMNKEQLEDLAEKCTTALKDYTPDK